MQFLLATLGVLSFAAIWIRRVRRTADDARSVLDATREATDAARRFGYRRRANQHPADGIEDPRVSAAALLVLVAETDGGISRAEQTAILNEIAAVFQLTADEALELYRFARWLADQTTNPDDMIRRLVKRTVHLGGRGTLPDLMRMVARVGEADTGTLTDDTIQVLEKLKQLIG